MEFNDMKRALINMANSKTPATVLTKGNFVAYFKVLSDLDYQVFRRVVFDVMKRGFDYYPQAGQLRKACLKALGAHEQTGEEAWQTFTKEAGWEVKRWSVKLKYVARQVGCEKYLMTESEQARTFLKKDFLRIWDEVDEVQADRAVLEPGMLKQLLKDGRAGLLPAGQED